MPKKKTGIYIDGVRQPHKWYKTYSSEMADIASGKKKVKKPAKKTSGTAMRTRKSSVRKALYK